MSEKVLKPNFIEKLISEIPDEYVEFFIPDKNGETKATFKIKVNPDFGEMLLIVNKTAEIINNIGEIDFRPELKKLAFYGILFETLSNLPVPKRKEDDIEYYDYDKFKIYLNRIGFERQLRSTDNKLNKTYEDLLFSISEMENAIEEKINYCKQQRIHNTLLIKETVENFNKLISSFKSIPEIIGKFSNSIDGVNNSDIKSLISAFTTLNADGNLSGLAENVVTAYLNKKAIENEDWLDQSIKHEFGNIIDFNKE